MNDRRSTPRRKPQLLAASVTRKRERRGEDRRDCPRCEIALDVREPRRKARAVTGDLSIGGVSFVTTAPPLGDVVSVMFTIPTYVGPIVANGVIVARKGAPKGTQVSVVFTDLEVEAELAIAQWIDREMPIVRGVELAA